MTRAVTRLWWLAILAILLVAVSSSASPQRYEDRIVARINEQRGGMVHVRPGACVDSYAEAWARHLAATNALYHRDQGTILDGCHATMAGEVIYVGSGPPREAVRMWMNSLSHHEVILNPDYRRIGVGAVWDEDRGVRVVVVDLVRH